MQNPFIKRKGMNVTLLVISAWIAHRIHAARPCRASLPAVQIRSRRICAAIQKPGMATLIHPYNLAPGIPCRGDGMTFLS
jgi:hypothetical protein